jgi:predicted transcriptional regulator YheO
MSASVGVVLNTLNRCRDIVLQSLEVDDTIFSAVTTADVSGRNSTQVVTTAAMALVVH